MKHPTDLDRATDQHVENQVIIHDEDSIPKTPEAGISRLWPGSGKIRQPSDGLLHTVHEGPCGIWVVPGDVIQNIKEVLLSGGKVAESVSLPHGTRVRRRRIIALWLMPFAPRAAWLSASSSLL